ncbi:hypothetical protein AB0G74_15060 [Streptomyces sp. NPDC020875]|uniref:hypothetical protein n=1 Tax=Streptomyces sp. NPDC020875 TaxID=3154898 RepID=UPI0033E30610
MSRCRIQFSDRALAQRRSMDAQGRAAVDDGMRRLATEPCGPGSHPRPVQPGQGPPDAAPADRDRRRWVHTGILVVTAVDIIH